MSDEPPCPRASRLIDLNLTAAALRQAANDIEAVAPTVGGDHDPPPRGLALARATLALRRKRDRLFPEGLFGEPVWDLLLDLYIARADGRTISVSSACIAAAVPPTTALRWLRELERRDLVVRTADTGDGRRVHVTLSYNATRLVERLLGP